MRHVLGALIGAVAASLLFGICLLVMWGFGSLMASMQVAESGKAKPEQVPLSSRTVWALVAAGPVVGGLAGALSYLIRSAVYHQWFPGDHAWQLVLGSIVGATAFGPIGLAFLTRRLPAGNIATLLMYGASLMFLGPIAVRFVMLALGLRVHGLY